MHVGPSYFSHNKSRTPSLSEASTNLDFLASCSYWTSHARVFFLLCWVSCAGHAFFFLNVTLINPVKVKLSLTSQEGSGSIECWASILTATFGATRTTELSALRAGLREFLEGRVRLSGHRAYWMRTEGISKDPTGNRTGNFPSRGVGPQPTAPQLAGWKAISPCGLSSAHCVREVSWSRHRLTCQIINTTCRVKKAFHLKGSEMLQQQQTAKPAM